MKRLRFKSLTMRIWATFTVVILIIICSISFLYLVAFRRISENAKIQDLKVAHDILLKSNNFDQPLNRFDEMRNLKNSDFFIYNVSNTGNSQIININKGGGPMQNPQLDGHQPPGYNPNSMKLWMASYIKSSSIYEKQFKGVYKGKEYLFIISSVDYGSSGKSYLISYIPNMEDNSLLYLVLYIGIIFIIIGFFTAKLAAGHISKPLKELENYTVKIAHKDWNEPINIKSDDEIGRLAESMNRMQNELKHADEEEKMFLQSISHDLKTPVMVIMSHAEAIIDGVYIDSPEKTAEIIKDEAICLEKKIKQMLYLNTLDYVMENNSENADIDMHDLLMHIVNRFELVNSEIEWDLEIDRVVTRGDTDKIQVSIENILDNALRYAESKIRLSLKQEDSFAVIEIYNDGSCIDSKHLGHIFDNLYKDKTGNFGLGLAITKKIVDFYNGDIKVVNREKGVSFLVRYPASPTSKA